MRKRVLNREIDGVQGATFGVMEGIIMGMGLVMGFSVTANQALVLLAVIIAGVADAIANSTGFYVSEESEMIHTAKEVRKAAFLSFCGTVSAFILLALPVALLPLAQGVMASVAIGVVVLAGLGVFVSSRNPKFNMAWTVVKYVVIGLVAAFLCNYLGGMLAAMGV